AVRAYLDDGQQLPLLRLIAENKRSSETGGPDVSLTDYSASIFLAVSCTDYPQIYDMHATSEDRRKQRARAFADEAAIDSDLYAPFTIKEFDAIPPDLSVLSLCVEWPQAPSRFQTGMPIAPGTPFPKIPVLVLTGDLDTLTP